MQNCTFLYRGETQVRTFLKLGRQEQKVVGLLGHSNKQIASKLGIAEGTVKWYISDMLAKLELDNRTQLALWASDHKHRILPDTWIEVAA